MTHGNPGDILIPGHDCPDCLLPMDWCADCGLCACWCYCWTRGRRRALYDPRYNLLGDERGQGTNGRMIDTISPQGDYL